MVINLKIADIVKDKDILKLARHHAQRLLKEDPNLEMEKHKVVKFAYSQLVKEKSIWNYIS